VDGKHRFSKDVEVIIADNDLRLPRGEMRTFLGVLVHVVRNAVDHGIESPEEREAANKRRQGRVTIESAVQGSTFMIAITDDGRGIDWSAS
jgi:two-component system chemotaxis sensor kinase CheA